MSMDISHRLVPPNRLREYWQGQDLATPLVYIPQLQPMDLIKTH
jgi:hypothetical protein